MGFKTIIFDLDGTVLDTLEDLSASVNYALESVCLPRRSIDEVRSFVGNGVRLLMERSVPEGTAAGKTQLAFDTFRMHYLEHCFDRTAPYEGIPELLASLKARGCSLALVSNKADPAVQELISRFFPGLFDVYMGERPGIKRKPAPDTVLSVMESLGSEPGSTVYVGDSDVDYLTAEAAGVSCCLVSWGFRDRKLLASLNPFGVADNVAELAELLE